MWSSYLAALWAPGLLGVLESSATEELSQNVSGHTVESVELRITTKILTRVAKLKQCVPCTAKFPVFSSWMVHGLSYSDSQSLGRMFRRNLVETELCLKESFSKIGDKSSSYIILLYILYTYYIHAFLISRLLMVYPSWNFGVAAAHHFLVAHPLNLKNIVFRVGSTVFKCNRLHPGNCSIMFKRLNTLREGGVTLTKTSPLQNSSLKTLCWIL